MINAQIRQFRDSIIAMTNASQLPIEIKRLVFSEIYTKIDAEANTVISMEKNEAQMKKDNNTQEEKENE